MARVLAVSDEVADALYGDALDRLKPDLILSCGDLPFDYLENLVTRAGVPLLYVLGNHDPDPKPRAEPGAGWPMGYSINDAPAGPEGCDSAEGRVLQAGGLYVAGLGGSIRYKAGPNQYTQGEMRRRALRLEARIRLRVWARHSVDIFIAHAPPQGVGDGADHAHQGFAAFHRLVEQLKPKVLVHGHVHPIPRRLADRMLISTLVVNAIPYRLLEV